MHLVGLYGMPRRVYEYDSGLGWDFLNLLETIGAFVIAFSTLVLLVNMIVSRRNGAPASDDPWDGRTLEWSIPSPPPEYNFAEIPLVENRDEFWHRKYIEDERTGRLVPVQAGAAGTHDDAGTDDHGSIHLPSPSFWPLVSSLGLPIIGYGVLYSWWLVALGSVVALVGFYGWALEPSVAEE
jgi:cytochrome c oxidase subunit 1